MNNHTWGPAVQVGLDVPLDDRFSLNLDVKRSNFRSDISAFGQTVDTKINSRVVSLGLGYRF
jgi:outer membrane protein